MQVANEGKINWVKHRGQCTMEAVLEAIREQVEGDVEQMNRLPAKTRDHCVFKTNFQYGYICVERYACANPLMANQTPVDVMCFQSSGTNEIEVYRDQAEKPALTFSFRWDEDKATCRFYVEGKACPLWQISQKALGSLFFEHRETGDRPT